MALLAVKISAAASIDGNVQPGTVQVKSASITVPSTIGLTLLSGTGPQGAQGPPGVGANWRGIWSGATTYALGDGVTGSDGHNYVSLVAGNLNHDPVGDGGVHWTDTIPSSVAAANAGTGPATTTGGRTNTGQILVSQGATWDASTVPFITTPASRSGVASGQVLADSTANNIFQVTGYVANTGTAPGIGLGGFGVGYQVWGANLLGAAIGKNATALGLEIDVGSYPAHFKCTVDGTTAVLTNIVVDRAGSSFANGDTVLATTGVPASTISSFTGPANAPITITLSAPTTIAGSNVGVSVTSTGQTATGLVIVGEGSNIGGVGNASGVGIQIQASTAGVGSGFGTGFRLSGSGLTGTSGIGMLFAGLNSTGGIGHYYNGCTLGYGIEFANGTYTTPIYLNGVTASSGINMSGGTLGIGIQLATGIGTGIYLNTFGGTDGINATNGTYSGSILRVNGATAAYGVNVSSDNIPVGMQIAGAGYTAGIYLNGVTATAGINLTNGTYTTAVYLSGVTATYGINFDSSTFSTAAILFGAGHNIAFDTATGTKIGTGTTQKLGFWNATPVVKPSAVTGIVNPGTKNLLTALASTGLVTDSTTQGGGYADLASAAFRGTKMAVGATLLDPGVANAGTGTLTTQLIYQFVLPLQGGTTVASLVAYPNAAGSSVTGCWYILLDTSRTVVGYTANLASGGGVGTTILEGTLVAGSGSSYAVPADGNYFFGLLLVFTGTTPQFRCFSGSSGIGSTLVPLRAEITSTTYTGPPVVTTSVPIASSFSPIVLGGAY